MSATERAVYRGVVELYRNARKPREGTYIMHLKPYEKPGPAKASVTILRSRWPKGFVSGWVEVATVWKKIEDE